MSAISAKTGGRGAGSRSWRSKDGEGELVGHRHPVERPPAVAEVGRGEHAVVAEVAGLRPGEGDRRHHRGGLPAGGVGEVQERAARAGEQRPVAALVVDRQARRAGWHGRASSGRRPSARSGSPSAWRGRRPRAAPRAAPSAAVTVGRVARVLQRRAAVGFDEDHEDVGAAQGGQDRLRRQGGEAVARGLGAEAREIAARALPRRADAPRPGGRSKASPGGSKRAPRRRRRADRGEGERAPAPAGGGGGARRAMRAGRPPAPPGEEAPSPRASATAAASASGPPTRAAGQAPGRRRRGRRRAPG